MRIAPEQMPATAKNPVIIGISGYAVDLQPPAMIKGNRKRSFDETKANVVISATARGYLAVRG